MYYYQNHPYDLSEDDTDLLDREYRNIMKHGNVIDQHAFDHIIVLHPNLLPKINDLLNKNNIDYRYISSDILKILEKRKNGTQNIEKYIDSSYISLKQIYPELFISKEIKKIN